MEQRFSSPGEPLQVFFIEYPEKKGLDIKIIQKGTLSFYPVFEKNEAIVLQEVAEEEPFKAVSNEPDKIATHHVIRTQMSFNKAGDTIIPVLSVMVKAIKPRSSSSPMPIVFSVGGERRNNRY